MRLEYIRQIIWPRRKYQMKTYQVQNTFIQIMHFTIKSAIGYDTVEVLTYIWQPILDQYSMDFISACLLVMKFLWDYYPLDRSNNP